MKPLKLFVLGANAVFILWILYNAIDDGFRDITGIQGIVPLALMFLLIVNFLLLWRLK